MPSREKPVDNNVSSTTSLVKIIDNFLDAYQKVVLYYRKTHVGIVYCASSQRDVSE